MFIVSALLLLYLGVLYPIIATVGAVKMRNDRPASLFVKVIAGKSIDEFKDAYYWVGTLNPLLVRDGAACACVVQRNFPFC